METISNIKEMLASSAAKRQPWESLWQDCYDYALPQRGRNHSVRRGEQLYDATALDAVDQLAASLLAHLVPPFTQWFGFKAGPAVSDEEATKLAPALEKAGQIVQGHFDRSNFLVEVHQSFLDLVVAGTGTLLLEEAPLGAQSAFRFTAVPLQQTVLDEGDTGMLDITYRQSELTRAQILSRFPNADLPAGKADDKIKLLETVYPENGNYRLQVFALLNEPLSLFEGRFQTSPFITFRWMKSPGDIYGRSPVMKALPDIKTANKVVELILKNASIAVTGIWQADDDGVLNPATVELVPGAIIPKAIGSKGLTPLEMPGRFDVSQLVLEDLRSRIRHALLVDKFPQLNASKRMTATEVLERSAETAMLLGATYGRLQVEFLTPLITRAYAILRRRGDVPDIALDGSNVMIDYRSPLARSQAQRHLEGLVGFIQNVLSLGGGAGQILNTPAIARYMGNTLGVSPEFLLTNETISSQQ